MLQVDACISQSLSSAEERFIDSVISSHYHSDAPGAVILVAKEGKPILRKAYGLASLEFKIPNQPEYIFNIGSMSKQFTAVCILILAQEGKLNLDDDVKKYISRFNSHGRTITVRQLLQHTSGIYNYSDKEDFLPKSVTDVNKEELMDYFMNDSLFFEPGTKWSYCNSGYALAALIVEKVSGKSLSEFMTEKIFLPNQMTKSYLCNDDSVFVNYVYGYEKNSKGTFMARNYMSWTYEFGAGGIITCVDDLLKFNNSLLGYKILKKEWLDQAWTAAILPDGRSTNYGMGWAVGSYKGLKFVAHGGGLNGFRSYGVLFPEKKLYVVILSNTSSTTPVAYASSIAFKLAGAPMAVAQTLKLNSKELMEYAGNYTFISPDFSFKLTQRSIMLKGDTLCSYVKEEDELLPLVKYDKDVFGLADAPKRFKFVRNKKGKIEAIQIFNEAIQYGPVELDVKEQ